ncbi:MAG: putative ABC transporter permease [Acutalibacteraceae bacterium]
MYEKQVTYDNIFWLFIFGSLVGVLMEGLWCLLKNKHWETHVVTVLEPLCVIYGFGMVGCYLGDIPLCEKSTVLKFFVFAVIGSLIELICGLVLKHCLNMRAWDYSNNHFNIKGQTSLGMSMIWGASGLIFSHLLPKIKKMLKFLSRHPFRYICAVWSVILTFDILLSIACFVRWSKRHKGDSASNKIEEFIDTKYDDEFMQKRFCEWEFIN